METLWEIAATALFLAAFAALVLRWFGEQGAQVPAPFDRPLPVRRGTTPTGEELWRIFAAALLFRVLFALGSWMLYCLLSGQAVPLAGLPDLWLRWDAPHYKNLVELGYGGYLEDGKPLFLVFYPLYVWCTRALALLIPDTALAGMTVSALCFAWGCVYLYRLVCLDYGPSIARRALAVLVLYPFSFFFGGIMTEGLFLLTTAAGLYHIRAHQWGRFALWGILAAMTRMMGLVLIGAAAAELCIAERPFAFTGKERRRALLAILARVPLLLLPLLGSGAYLALNHRVTGNAFAFTQMQEHWSQGFQWFPSVLSYLAENALHWPKPSTRWEMWIPELVLFVLFALLLWRHWRRHRSTYVLYAFVCLILNYCLSWLLSAGRYLSCDLPCFFFLAEDLEGRPKATAALGIGMGLLQAFFLYRYFCWGQVM